MRVGAGSIDLTLARERDRVRVADVQATDISVVVQ